MAVIKDKTFKRKRHKLNYEDAILYYGLEDEFNRYLKEHFVKNKVRRNRIYSIRRVQAAFCKSKKLPLHNSVFDQDYLKEAGL